MKIAQLKSRHRNEYFKLLVKHIAALQNSKQVDATIEELLQQIVNKIDSLSETEKKDFISNPEFYLNTKFINEFLTSSLKFGKIFREQLVSCWKDCLDLGVQHQIDEMLWQASPLKEELVGNYNKINLSSFSIENLSSMFEYFQENSNEEKEEESIAEFESVGDRNIRVARAKQQRLLENIEILKRMGVYNSLDYDTKLAARFSINERYRFLESLNYIGNYANKARAANRYYLGRTYFNQRTSILGSKYSETQNNQVKQYIADYLKNDSVALSELLKKDQRMQTLINKIQRKVAKDKNKQSIKGSAEAKARAILRTELSIGYNLGKLSGFMAPEDWDTKFIWNASFELEDRREGYQVCEYCRKMHGTVMTVREIMRDGAGLDTSSINYNRGRNRKKQINLNNPQIPFHVNCSCFWQIAPDQEKTKQLMSSAADITSGTRKKEKSVIKSILNPKTLIGAGLLLVGTGLLISRSNAFREMIKSIPDMPLTTDNPVTTTISAYDSASNPAKSVIRTVLSTILGI